MFVEYVKLLEWTKMYKYHFMGWGISVFVLV